MGLRNHDRRSSHHNSGVMAVVGNASSTGRKERLRVEGQGLAVTEVALRVFGEEMGLWGHSCMVS